MGFGKPVSDSIECHRIRCLAAFDDAVLDLLSNWISFIDGSGDPCIDPHHFDSSVPCRVRCCPACRVFVASVHTGLFDSETSKSTRESRSILLVDILHLVSWDILFGQIGAGPGEIGKLDKEGGRRRAW